MGIFNSFAGKSVQAEKAALQKNAADELNASIFEAVSASVLVTDADFNIVKVNPAAQRMFREAESDIRRQLPHFSADRLVGCNMDVFHEDPEPIRRRMQSLTDTWRSNVSIGGRPFQWVANPVYGTAGKRLGVVLEWEDMSEKQARQQADSRREEESERQAADSARMRAALDCVGANVLLADASGIIIYANEAARNMLRDAEEAIRHEHPSFSSDKLIGSPLHQFSQGLSQRQTAINLGGHTLQIRANPVHGAGGERLGTVVDWEDHSEEHELVGTVTRCIAKAVKGEMGERIDLGGREGVFAEIAGGINELMDTFSEVMEDAAASLGAMAAGRLTRRIDSDYQGRYGQLKDDINATIDRLVEMVNAINEASRLVKEGAGEIASGNANLSRRTEEQASSLEETSAAMEEITTTVQQNAASSQQANTLARSARETAENGGSVVGKAIGAMQAISESSNKINDIISVIDEIAFQTNLLSLNAAVEAARAGDQGRGFAVVADEVRSLAGRSATAAKEIKELIKDSVAKVQEGSTLVNQSGETLTDIVSAVKKVNDIVAEISTASEEQASGLDEINRAIGGMDDMTQQNAALVEQAAAASDALGSQADNLEKLIACFDTGKPRAAPPARPAPSAARPASTVARGKAAAPNGSPAAPTARRRPPTPPRREARRATEVPAAPVKWSSREENDQDWSEF